MSADAPPKVDGEFPVPPIWRPTFEALVEHFVRGDFRPTGLRDLDPISAETAEQMEASVADYDQVTLAPLTEETWTTSVAQWLDGSWRTLIDLRTEEEGRSDLCLETDVHEVDGGYRFDVRSVYVP